MVRAYLAGEAATHRLGRSLASLLAPPALVTLAGELGTGKTTLIRAALRALGVRDTIVSPSFTIAQSYSGRSHLPLHHLDLYRLSPGADVELFAWDDYLTPHAITFVEWPEAGTEALPPADVRVRLQHQDFRSRIAEVEAAGEIEQRLAEVLVTRGVRTELVSSELAWKEGPLT